VESGTTIPGTNITSLSDLFDIRVVGTQLRWEGVPARDSSLGQSFQNTEWKCVKKACKPFVKHVESNYYTWVKRKQTVTN
jgi:hypothetical protein